jgi:hypothetical protein
VERFMGVLVKTVHAAVAMGKDPQTEVQRRLLNYRNTPHPSTGKSPSELIMNRRLKTKVPARLATSDTRMHQEAKVKDKAMRLDRKEVYDKKHRVKEQTIKMGDKVLIKQQKTTVKPPFDPKPYSVTEVKGTQVTAVRGNQKKVRSKEKVKLLQDRPRHLQGKVAGLSFDSVEEEEDDEDEQVSKRTIGGGDYSTGGGDCRRGARRARAAPTSGNTTGTQTGYTKEGGLASGPWALEREGSQAEPQGEEEEAADGQEEGQGEGPHALPAEEQEEGWGGRGE